MPPPPPPLILNMFEPSSLHEAVQVVELCWCPYGSACATPENFNIAAIQLHILCPPGQYEKASLLPKQCLHNGVLTFRVKELVADRNGVRGGVTGPWFRRSRCGFARIPLRFDAPAVVSREFRCISTLPLWFRANSGLSWPLQASSGGAT